MINNVERPLKVFLCHSSGDKPAIRALYKKLVDEGIDTWLDEEKVLPGQDWEAEILKAVRNSDAIIVCLSNKSITKEGYVQKEINYALTVAEEKPEGTIFIIPSRLEECSVPKRLSKRQYVDLLYENGEFNTKGYQMLIKALYNRAKQIDAALPKIKEQKPPRDNGDIVTYNTTLVLRAFQGAYLCIGKDGLLRVNSKAIDQTMKFEIVSPLEPLSSSNTQPIHYGDEISIRTPKDLNFLSLEQYSRGFWKSPIYFGHSQIFTIKYVPFDYTVSPNKIVTSYKAAQKSPDDIIRYGDYFMLVYSGDTSVVVGYGGDSTAKQGVVWLERTAAYSNKPSVFPDDQPNPYNIFSFVNIRRR